MTASRRSRKRDAILEALRATKAHPSAEWIYASVKKEVPDLSLGTVYRNLSRFVQEGSAIRVATVEGQERFDADTSPHAHFICRVCGDVADIGGIPRVDTPDVDGVVEGYQLNYHGLCRICHESATRDACK